MTKACSAFALSCLLLFAAHPAQAFLDPPYVTPKHPIAGETIYVNINGGVCDIVDTGLQPPPITQEGNAVRIAFFGAHFDNPELCTIGVGTAVFPIGGYGAGAYTLQVDRAYPGAGGEIVLETLGVIPFTVGAAISAPVPSSSDDARIAMILLIVGIGMWRLRYGRRQKINFN